MFPSIGNRRTIYYHKGAKEGGDLPTILSKDKGRPRSTEWIFKSSHEKKKIALFCPFDIMPFDIMISCISYTIQYVYIMYYIAYVLHI